MANKNNQNKKKPPSAHDLFSMPGTRLQRGSQRRNADIACIVVTNINAL
jgi:hypothetical protein